MFTTLLASITTLTVHRLRFESVPDTRGAVRILAQVDGKWEHVSVISRTELAELRKALNGGLQAFLEETIP